MRFINPSIVLVADPENLIKRNHGSRETKT